MNIFSALHDAAAIDYDPLSKVRVEDNEDDLENDDLEVEEEPQVQQEEPSKEGEELEIDEDYNYPEWLPDELKIPKLDNAEEKAAYLERAYQSTLGFLESEEFKQTLIDKYADVLAGVEGEVAEFKQHFQAFRSNPEQYVLAHMPQFAESLGLQPLIDDNQRAQLIEEIIEERYPNFKDVYDSTEALRPGTISSRIYKDMIALDKAIDEDNAARIAKREEVIQSLASGKKVEAEELTPEQIEQRQSEMLDQYYSSTPEINETFTKEEILDVANEMKGWTPTPLDLMFAFYADSIIENERAEAYEAGRKEALASLNGASKMSAEDFVPEVGTKDNRKTVNILDFNNFHQ